MVEVVVSRVVAPCTLVAEKERFGGPAASVFMVEVRDQGDASTAVWPTQRS
jgi:hypothetical protein